MSMGKLLRWMLAGVLAGMSGACAGAQDRTISEALQNLQQRAGVVFSGQVMEVRKTPGVVSVVFRVDHGVKGPQGGVYVLREWGGLWAAGQRRYWVGERALVFLYSPNAASGLSSAVDGMEGVLPEVAGTSASAPSFAVSRLRTRLLRPVGAPLVGSAEAMTLSNIRLTLMPVKPQPVNWRGVGVGDAR